MTDSTQLGTTSEAAPVALPRVRIDKSRAHQLVSGNRTPDDLHASVFFYQDGIPADSNGFFIFDHPDMQRKGPDGDKARKAAERKIKKALADQAKNPPPPVRAADSDDDDEDAETESAEAEAEEDLLEPVNLDAWARGEQAVEWNDVTQEIARRYKVRKSKIKDAIEFLITEGVVPKAQVAPKFLKLLD